MNSNDFGLVNFNWKKWLKILVGILVSLFILRMVVMTLFFGEAFKFVKSFNEEFVTGQQAIHNKIETEHDGFKTRAAEFDRVHEKIGQDFQDLRDSFDKGWSRSNKLAQQVYEAKSKYETKLNECKADKECQKYITE